MPKNVECRKNVRSGVLLGLAIINEFQHRSFANLFLRQYTTTYLYDNEYMGVHSADIQKALYDTMNIICILSNAMELHPSNPCNYFDNAFPAVQPNGLRLKILREMSLGCRAYILNSTLPFTDGD